MKLGLFRSTHLGRFRFRRVIKRWFRNVLLHVLKKLRLAAETLKIRD